jgi:hypothetical protein
MHHLHDVFPAFDNIVFNASLTLPVTVGPPQAAQGRVRLPLVAFYTQSCVVGLKPSWSRWLKALRGPVFEFGVAVRALEARFGAQVLQAIRVAVVP